MQTAHQSVLLQEVLKVLNPQPNDNFIDCTLGGAGHSYELLKLTGPNGQLLAFDLDENAISRAREKLAEFGKRVILQNKSFVNLQETVKQLHFSSIKGILLDLGWSMDQIVSSGKGFTFQKDEPLDMRYSSSNPLTAKTIVNTYSQEQLAQILWENSQETFSRQIAQAIIKQRKIQAIETTFDLKNIIASVVWKRGKIDPATKTFQALRIAVNDEFGSLQKVLEQAIEVLPQNSRLAVITFHSTEDRIVKQFFKEKQSQGLIRLINKKVIKPQFGEVKLNRSARSAKLRAIEKN